MQADTRKRHTQRPWSLGSRASQEGALTGPPKPNLFEEPGLALGTQRFTRLLLFRTLLCSSLTMLRSRKAADRSGQNQRGCLFTLPYPEEATFSARAN